jgi:hypothetical protein
LETEVLARRIEQDANLLELLVLLSAEHPSILVWQREWYSVASIARSFRMDPSSKHRRVKRAERALLREAGKRGMTDTPADAPA